MSDTSILNDFCTRPELAQDFGCSERTIWRYESQPDGLPSVMIGGRKFYRIQAVREWLNARERRPNPRRAA